MYTQTLGVPGRGSTVESHEDGCEGHVTLHNMLPDAVQDRHGEVDVQVTQEHNAVVILGNAAEEERRRRVHGQCLQQGYKPEFMQLSHTQTHTHLLY